MKTSMLFPGQGSQSIGMLSEAYAEFSVVQDCFAEATDLLGFDMWALIQSGSLEELNKTENTQPAVLIASVALFRVWQELGGTMPVSVAGHSLGEYSALVCAGALDFSDALKLVEARGHFMQAAVPPGEGAMAAIIGLDNAAIADACQQSAHGEVVAPVNYNSPGQVVIAGSSAAVERAMTACKDAGAKRALPLPVSVPSHCALMLPAADKLSAMLEGIDIKTPAIPVVQNVGATVATSSESIASNLVAQLHQPVLWTQCIEAIADSGANLVIECGPGKVLNGLTKRINKTLQSASINDAASLAATLEH